MKRFIYFCVDFLLATALILAGIGGIVLTLIYVKYPSGVFLVCFVCGGMIALGVMGILEVLRP